MNDQYRFGKPTRSNIVYDQNQIEPVVIKKTNREPSPIQYLQDNLPQFKKQRRNQQQMDRQIDLLLKKNKQKQEPLYINRNLLVNNKSQQNLYYRADPNKTKRAHQGVKPNVVSYIDTYKTPYKYGNHYREHYNRDFYDQFDYIFQKSQNYKNAYRRHQHQNIAKEVVYTKREYIPDKHTQAHKNKNKVNQGKYKNKDLLQSLFNNYPTGGNLFSYHNQVMQSLPICQKCSTKLHPIPKSSICIQKGCNKAYEIICDICKQNHYMHKSVRVMQGLFEVYKQPKQLNYEKAIDGIQNIIKNINQFQISLRRLLIKVEQQNIKYQQSKLHYKKAKEDLDILFKNIQRHTQQETMLLIHKIVKNIYQFQNDNNLNSNVQSYIPIIKQSMEKLPDIISSLSYESTETNYFVTQKSLPMYKILYNDFYNKQIWINSGWNCDFGHLQNNINFQMRSVGNIQILMSNNEYQSNLLKLLQMLSSISKKRIIKSISLQIQKPYKQMYLQYISSQIKYKQLHLHLGNLRTQSMKNQIWNFFRVFTKDLRSFSLWFAYDKKNRTQLDQERSLIFRNFVQVISTNCVNLCISIPYNLPLQQQNRLLLQLAQKKKLTYLQLNEPQNQNICIYVSIKNKCKKRKQFIQIIAYLKHLNILPQQIKKFMKYYL